MKGAESSTEGRRGGERQGQERSLASTRMVRLTGARVRWDHWPVRHSISMGGASVLRPMKLAALVLLAAGCMAETPIPLTDAARKIRTGKNDPDPTMEEVGPIEATSGHGCGGFGERGTYKAAMVKLKNKAARSGANYVQIFTMTEPHSGPGCFDNSFVIRGTAFRIHRGPAETDDDSAGATDPGRSAP